MHRLRFVAFLFALAYVTGSSVARAEDEKAPRVQVEGATYVLVRGTYSPDGRYALGWTVQPVKDGPPVDWTLFDAGFSEFFDKYIESEEHVLKNAVIEVAPAKVVLTLEMERPYFTRKNHGDLNVVWGPEAGGRRFALVESEAKWAPTDVVLFDVGADDASQADAWGLLNEATIAYVKRQLRRNQRGREDEFTVSYGIEDCPEIGTRTGFADGTTLRVPFAAEVPKDETTPVLYGTLTLKLSHAGKAPVAKVIEARGRSEKTQPLEDDPRLLAADRELNKTYGALKMKLKAAEGAQLVAEQRAWIEERDRRVEERADKAWDLDQTEKARILTDRLLRELTEERTRQLKARLE